MTADFENLIQQNSGRIRRIALRYAAHGDREDLIQEILLALWRSYAGFRGDSRLETWVYKVALNTAFSRVRKQVAFRNKNEKFRGLYREDISPDSLPENDILTAFLNSLNEMDASVMMMTLDGMTPGEIEEVTGASANAITVRINRIKQKYIDTYID